MKRLAIRPLTRRLPAAALAAALSLGLGTGPSGAQDVRPAEPVAPPTTPAGGNLSQQPDKNLFEYADYVYSQKQWNLAASQYKRYLERFPGGADAAAAWYRLGECHFKGDDSVAAEQAYLQVMRSHKESAFGPAAAYRLATLYYARQNYRGANPYFEIAQRRSEKAAIQLSAAYYRAHCLRELGMEKETIEAFQAVADFEGIDPEANPYIDAALQSIARLTQKSGDKAGAIAAYEKLAETTRRTDFKAEALVKSGLLHSSLGDDEAAEAALLAALDLRGGDEWKPDAQFHLISRYYVAGKYNEATEIYRKGAFAMADELRSSMLLMVGNAYRKIDRFREAVDVYFLLREHYPATREAAEAEYYKLICFYKMRNPNLPEFVDDYIDWQSRRNASDKHIDMARLLKAEQLFTNGVFNAAGATYDQIRVAQLPESLRSGTLYKRGWAHTEAGNHTLAVRAYSDFLEGYPDDPRAATALAKRAISFRSVDDYTSALRDFEKIISDFPESDAAELSYQQVALIKGQQRDNKGMIESFSALLEKYPQSKAVPEAHFWIGWGQYEEKDFAAAAESLRKARELDRATFYERATLRIVLSEYSQQKVAAVRSEIEAIPDGTAIAIPPQVYLWLGVNLYDAAEYTAAATYLSRAVNHADPAATQPVIWKRLGEARLYTGAAGTAIEAFDHYLESRQPATNRARVLHDKAVATLVLGEPLEAEKIVEEALSLQPQSRVYGQLCILWGEIALRADEPERAVQRLVKPTYAIDDEEITPTALYKSAKAHEALGQTEKAAELRARLKERFPSYRDDRDAIKGLPAEA